MQRLSQIRNRVKTQKHRYTQEQRALKRSSESLQQRLSQEATRPGTLVGVFALGAWVGKKPGRVTDHDDTLDDVQSTLESVQSTLAELEAHSTAQNASSTEGGTSGDGLADYALAIGSSFASRALLSLAAEYTGLLGGAPRTENESAALADASGHSLDNAASFPNID